MLTVGLQVNTPSEPEHGNTRQAEAPQNGEPVSSVMLGHAAGSIKALWHCCAERTHMPQIGTLDHAEMSVPNRAGP